MKIELNPFRSQHAFTLIELLAFIAIIAVGPGAVKVLLPDLDLTKLGDQGLGEDGIVLKSAGSNLILPALQPWLAARDALPRL